MKKIVPINGCLWQHGGYLTRECQQGGGETSPCGAECGGGGGGAEGSGPSKC